MAKNRFIYFIALVFGLLTAFLYESSVGFILLYGLLILGTLAFISLALAPLLISVKQDGGGRHLLKGDEVSFTVTLRNKSPLLYPMVQLRLADSHRISYSKAEPFTLGPRERTDIDLNVSMPYRGIYTLGVRRVVLCDFMGLFRLSFAVAAPPETVVYPCKLDEYSSTLNQDILSRETASYPLFSQTFEDYSDLRPYDPHDDSRKIHWKLSAKRNQLIVKNFRSSTLSKTHVIVDTRPVPAANPSAFEDYLISVAAAAIDFAMANRLMVGLLCGPGDERGTEANALSGQDALWEALARTVFDAAQGIIPCLRQILQREEDLYDLVLILSRLEQSDYDAIADVCTLGHSVTLCYVSPPQQPPSTALAGLLEALENLGAQINLFEQE